MGSLLHVKETQGDREGLAPEDCGPARAGLWSETLNFTTAVKQRNLLSRPILLRPRDGATGVSTEPTNLRWQPVARAAVVDHICENARTESDVNDWLRALSSDGVLEFGVGDPAGGREYHLACVVKGRFVGLTRVVNGDRHPRCLRPGTDTLPPPSECKYYWFRAR